MDKTELPHNQLILNTGECHTGIIFCPFGTETPSEYTAEKAFANASSSPRKVAIGGSGSGWITPPDTGGTSLSKEVPVGDALILLFFAATWAAWKSLFRKRNLFFMLIISLFAGQIQAAVTDLSFSPTAAGTSMTIVPTIASVPDEDAAVCWCVYYDPTCENEVADIHFQRAASAGKNAVSFTAPTTAGTYYIKTSLHTGALCGGLLDSYYISPLIIYPADADIVLQRDAQSAASRVDITDDATKKAYGVMRFSKTALNDDTRSAYERYNYFISFPFDVRIGDIYGIGTVGTDWRILYYDGQGRAEEGFFAERTSNWIMFGDTDDVLRAGEGYLLQLNTISMDEDNSSIWTNDAEIATLFFPARSNITDPVTTDATLAALGSDYECTIDLSASLGAEGDRTKKDSYWRCIGVPSFSSPSGVEGLEYFYEWNTADNSLTVRSSEGFLFTPTQAYLVQNKDAITWLDVTKPAGIVARQRDTSYEELELTFEQNETFCDRTYIRLSDEARVTNGFDFGRDLSKEINAGKANIYTMVGYERLAANMLPDSVTRVPVGVQIEQEGEYKINVRRNNVPCTIFDTVTGIRSTDHTVHLDAGTHEGRFAVEIGETVSTSIQDSDVRYQKSAVRKVLKDGMIYIIRDDKAYYITGEVVQKGQK